MNLVSWKQRSDLGDSFDLFNELQTDMNKLFDYSLAKHGKNGSSEWNWSPSVDIADSKDAITLKAEIPGLSKDQIDVTLEEGILTIKGEKKEEKEEKDKKKNLVRTERYYGSFSRSFSLPSGVDEKNVKADYKNGVLSITLPKKEEAKAKQIKVAVS